MERHVSENPRRVRVYGAAFQPAVDDETASHSRAEGEHRHSLTALSDAVQRFSQRRALRVVGNQGGNAQISADIVAKRGVAPTDIIGKTDFSRHRIHQPRRTDSYFSDTVSRDQLFRSFRKVAHDSFVIVVRARDHRSRGQNDSVLHYAELCRRTA